MYDILAFRTGQRFLNLFRKLGENVDVPDESGWAEAVGHRFLMKTQDELTICRGDSGVLFKVLEGELETAMVIVDVETSSRSRHGRVDDRSPLFKRSGT
jgi:hypothetical protein